METEQQIPVKKMSGVKPFREIALILLGIFAILFLFTLQGILQQVDYGQGDELTGDVIKIGRDPEEEKKILFGEPSGKEPPPEQVPVKKEEPIVNKNLQCWLSAGVQREDLKIIGALLQTTPCALSKERKEIKAYVKGKCLIFNTEKKAITGVCVDTPVPSFSIDLPTEGTGKVTVPVVKRNYWLAILFLLVLFIVFGIWSWDETRDTFRRKYDHKRYDPLELHYGKGRAPSYKDVSTKEETLSKEVNTIYQKLVREKERRSARNYLQQKDLGTIATLFNKFSDKLYQAIKENRVIRAERAYKKLLRIYPALFHAVNQENRKIILKVIVYFGKQVALLQKSEKISHLIKKAYADAAGYKVHAGKPPLPESKQAPVISEDLDKSLRALKQVLSKAKDTKSLKRSKKVFTTGK